MVICLERGADLHMAQLMPLPLTVSCFSKIQIGFTFLVPAQLGSPGQRAVKRVCVCVFVYLNNMVSLHPLTPHIMPSYTHKWRTYRDHRLCDVTSPCELTTDGASALAVHQTNMLCALSQ